MKPQFIRFLSLIFLLVLSHDKCLGHTSSGITSNEVYHFSSKREAVWLGAGIGLGSVAYYFHSQLAPFNQLEVQSLTQPTVIGVDQVALGRWSVKDHTLSNWGFYGSFVGASSCGLLLSFRQERSWSHMAGLLLIGAEANLMTLSGTELTKSTLKRTRPYVYYDGAPLDEKTEKDARKSFFSGHASFTACNAFLAARFFADYYPHSKWKPLVWTLAVALPAFVAVERVRAGKHFPTDVVTGYAFGAAIGYLVPYTHKKSIKGSASHWEVYPRTGPSLTGVTAIWYFQKK